MHINIGYISMQVHVLFLYFNICLICFHSDGENITTSGQSVGKKTVLKAVYVREDHKILDCMCM
jgi:hypothetical protein